MGLWKSRLVSLAAIAACVPAPATAQLIPNTDGSIVYDTVNNISWVADGNLAASNRFGLPVCVSGAPQPCVNASGSMRYNSALTWIAAMNTANYFGQSNWQLPTSPMTDPGCGKVGPQNNSFGFGCTLNALGSLYYKGLGLTAPATAVPILHNTVGPFTNFQPYLYWSQSPGQGGNASFSFNSGFQGANTVDNFLYVLPMIPGKIAGTPPATGNGLQVNLGGQTIYDPVTNVTWLANANLAATTTFGLPHCTSPATPAVCVDQDGAMTVAAANQFIANMNAAAYMGQTNWELPPVGAACSGYQCNAPNDPMAELFNSQLGLGEGTPVAFAPDIFVGLFHNIQPYLYFSCQAATIQSPCETAGPAPDFEWSFSFGNGFLGTDVLENEFYILPYFVGPPANLCTYSLSSAGQVFTAAGGTGTITITTSPTCPWTVGPLPAWVTLTSPASGTGNGTVTFQVSPSTGADLSSTFYIGSTPFTLDLEASAIPGLSFIGSMPHLAAEGGWNTTFTFVNKSPASATARINLFSPGGGALTLPIDLPQQPASASPLLASSLDQTIAPNALFLMEATGPANVPYLEGSAQLNATGSFASSVDGFAIFHYNPTQQEAAVPLETRNANSYLLAFDNTNSVLTGVALENISFQNATIPVILRNDAGAAIGSGSISLNAYGHASFVLSTQFPVTANIRGTVEFDTPPGGQISALGIRYTPLGTLTTIPVLANVTSAGGLMAHLASGAGWQTTFVLANTGISAATATLNFYDDNGNPLTLPLTFPQSPTALPVSAPGWTQNIAANASLYIQSVGSATGALSTGSAQLTTTGNIGGFVIFRYNPNGQEAVVPLESRNASAYLLAFDNTNGTATGVAIGSMSSQSVSVPVIIRNDAGVQVGTPTISLNPNGHSSFVLSASPQFSSTANIRGTIEFDAPQGAQISVLGIRSPPALTFTTLPALAK